MLLLLLLLLLTFAVIIPLVNLGPVQVELDGELASLFDVPVGALLELRFKDAMLLGRQALPANHADWRGSGLFALGRSC